MNDGNPRHLEPRSNPRAAGGFRWFQFSLASVFVVVTAMAMILSTFFSVGRLVGMSNREVLMQGLTRFLYVLPTLLVWIVGLGMAIRRLKRNRAAAILTIIALGGLVLTALVAHVVQMALMHLLTSDRTGVGLPYWGFTLLAVIYAVLDSACWILILLAIFARRPPDAPQPERADPSGGPFSLTSVFVIIALMVIVLAIFFGVDRLLAHLIFTLPTLLVWIVGLRMASRRRNRNRVPAILTMIALGGLVLTTLVAHVVQMELMRLLTPGQISTWGFPLVGVGYAVLQPIWWSLTLLAIFAQRPPDAPQPERADPGGHPFLTNENYAQVARRYPGQREGA
jgi:hypothetical protein